MGVVLNGVSVEEGNCVFGVLLDCVARITVFLVVWFYCAASGTEHRDD